MSSSRSLRVIFKSLCILMHISSFSGSLKRSQACILLKSIYNTSTNTGTKTKLIQCNIMSYPSKVLFLKMTNGSLYYTKVANKTTAVIRITVKQITIPPQTFLLQILHFFSPEIAVPSINSATFLLVSP